MRYLFALLSLVAPGVSSAWSQVVWTYSGATSDRVQSSQSDGSNLQDLWIAPTAAPSPWGIAGSAAEGRVYWTDLSGRTVSGVNLDGSNASTLFSYSAAPISSLAYDSAGSQFFFVASTGVNGIVRSNSNGSSQSTLISISPTNSWLAFDASSRYLYFTESTANRIARVNVDGSPVVQSVVTLNAGSQARGVALDGNGGLYWVENSTDNISKVDISSFTGTPLSGTVLFNTRTLTDNTNSTPNGLATDGTYLYWADGASPFRGIYRTDITGENGVRLTLDNTGSPIGVVAFAAVPEPSTLLLTGGIGVAGVIVWYRRHRRGLRQ